jgi:hypothetical protein
MWECRSDVAVCGDFQRELHIQLKDNDLRFPFKFEANFEPQDNASRLRHKESKR